MATLKTLNQRLSYIVGENMAMQMKSDGLEIDAAALALAVNDVLAGKPSALTMEDKESVVEEIRKLSKTDESKEQSCCSDSNCCG